MKTWTCQVLLRQTSQFIQTVALIEMVLPSGGQNGLL